MSDPERLTHERVYDGKVFNVDRDRVRMPNGREVTVDVVRHSRSVVLIPVPEPGKVILIKQYRYAVNRWLWELPAGSVDEGEQPEAAARRECHEEIGQVPDTIVRLAALHPTPGYCDEEMLFFRLSGLSQPTEAAAPGRGRRHRAARLQHRRCARDGPPRRDHRHEDGGGAGDDLVRIRGSGRGSAFRFGVPRSGSGFRVRVPVPLHRS